MVGGDPSIGQGCNIFGSQAGIQLDDGAVVLRKVAMPPSIVKPGKAGEVQCISLPARHSEQKPQVICGWRLTLLVPQPQ